MSRAWLTPLLLGCLLAGLFVVPASGASVTVVRFPGHGAAKLTTGKPNQVYVNVSGLADGRWAEALWTGSCTHLGTRLLALPTLIVSGGVARRTNTLTPGQATVAKGGAIRIARGRTVLCASFAPKPTPTPSASASPTATASPTGTETATPSPTETATGTATATPTATATTPDQDLSGTWHVAAGSWAGYRVVVTTVIGQQERSGRTTAVAGSATLTDGAGGRSITSSEYTSDLTQLQSGDATQDQQVATALDTQDCPTGDILQEGVAALGSDAVLSNGQPITMPAKVTLRCTTNDETINGTVTLSNGQLRIVGSATFRLADFGIPRTVAGGLGTLAETGTFEFDLYLSR